ncbi:MAG: hypothetical protein IPJ88_02130 [Myxococcales bacterium]|nr:MAG: hypothetical protein IPJ88_02130 [Myxococcales bacterium]
MKTTPRKTIPFFNFLCVPHAAVASALRVSHLGSNSIGAAGSLNANGTACSGGTDSSSFPFSLSATQAQSLLLSLVAIRYYSFTPGSGFVEYEAELYAHPEVPNYNGNPGGMAIASRLADSVGAQSVLGSFNADVDLAVIAVELK